MTIQVQRPHEDAVVHTTEQQQHHRDNILSQNHQHYSYHDDEGEPSSPTTAKAISNSSVLWLDRIPYASSSPGWEASTVSDDESVQTSLSTDSNSNSSLSSSSSFIRVVSFASELVTDVWTRPLTPDAERSLLYYSTEETQRFRHEYRLEKKLLILSEAAVARSNFGWGDENIIRGSSRAISRVVVLHQDKMSTFSASSSFLEKDDLKDNVNTNNVLVKNDAIVPGVAEGCSDENGAAECAAFFDTPEFWSGSITWW